MVYSKLFRNFVRKIEIFNKILKHVTCFYDAKHVTCFKILLRISIFLKNFKTTCYTPSQKLLFRPRSTRWAIICSKFQQKVKTCYMFSILSPIGGQKNFFVSDKSRSCGNQSSCWFHLSRGTWRQYFLRRRRKRKYFGRSGHKQQVKYFKLGNWILINALNLYYF